MRTISPSAIALSAILIAACHGSTGAVDPTPLGTTPVTASSLTGCTPLQPGCFATGGGAYSTPAASATCANPGGPREGSADTHCKGRIEHVVASSCNVRSPPGAPDGGAASDAGNPGGTCGENGAAYGATMDGREGDDDDCKYHVSYEATPICENDGFYFVVVATYLASGAPLTGACTSAELCLDGRHPAPVADYLPPTGGQQVVEGPPGTYTIGPLFADAPGDWTVRFHFNAICCDVVPSSPHGHAAFHLTVN